MSFEEFLIASVAIVGGLGIAALAIVMGIRHDRRKRELEHIERMKALELGRTLPRDEPWLSPAKIGAAIAILVPIGAFASASESARSTHDSEAVWMATFLVSIAAVISGAVVVAMSIKKRATPSETATAKPFVEEDAYDVVSSRG
jgi:hypothetical protein